MMKCYSLPPPVAPNIGQGVCALAALMVCTVSARRNHITVVVRVGSYHVPKKLQFSPHLVLRVLTLGLILALIRKGIVLGLCQLPMFDQSTPEIQVMVEPLAKRVTTFTKCQNKLNSESYIPGPRSTHASNGSSLRSYHSCTGPFHAAWWRGHFHACGSSPCSM
jgi:hypothetical protein